MIKTRFASFSLLFALFIFGCGSAAQTVAPNPTVVLVLPTKYATETYPPTPTNTPLPTDTPVPTPIPTIDPNLRTAYKWALQIVDQTLEVGVQSSMAIDSQDLVHISYFDDKQDDLRYATGQDNYWVTQVVESDRNVGYPTSLALDARGQPQIVFYDRTKVKLKYSRLIKTSWQTDIIFNDDMPASLRLVLDRQGLPYILYLHRNGGVLTLLSRNPTQWISSLVASVSPDGLSADLGIDSKGTLHVCYYDSGLYYGKWVGDTWQREKLVDGIGVGKSCSLAIDQNGIPMISFYDETDTKLKFINVADKAIQVVDPDVTAGPYSSIAVDSQGIVHIAYVDLEKQALMYAQGIGSSWQTTLVDPNGSGNHYISLALNSNGLPEISYYDLRNRRLKIAIADFP